MDLLYIAMAISILVLLVKLVTFASYADEVRNGGNRNLDNDREGWYDPDD